MVAVAEEDLGRSRCAADTGLRADRQAGGPSKVDVSFMRILRWAMKEYTHVCREIGLEFVRAGSNERVLEVRGELGVVDVWSVIGREWGYGRWS